MKRDSKGRFVAGFRNVPSWFKDCEFELVEREGWLFPGHEVRLVRKPKGTFAHPEDPAAVVVASWSYIPSMTRVTEVALNYLKLKEVQNGNSGT